MFKGSYLKGIPKTEEWKKKVFTKEYAENMSKIKKGHSTSNETKDKIGKANKGRHLTPQTEFKKGHKVPKEWREKSSSSNLGKPTWASKHPEEMRKIT